MGKINFTQEHKTRLINLCIGMLFSGDVIKGPLGMETNIYDLIHNTTVNSLVTINSNLKKEIERLSNLDECSLNAYQQRKLSETKEAQELVNLLIGFKKLAEQVKSDKARIAELTAKKEEIEKSSMTPAEQLAA